MRTLLAAAILAGGMGLIGASAVSAAPTSGLAIKDPVEITGKVLQQAHWRWRSRHRHRNRCHRRHRSGWYRC
jgi:hypothetical protein